MNDQEKKEVQRMIDEAIRNAVGFSHRKLGDSPSDANQLTPQKYVDLNGTIANRPVSSIANMGQRYYPTDINIPMFYNGNASVWVNGVGSTIASG